MAIRDDCGALDSHGGRMNLSKAAIAQVMIPVDDFERGVAFYRDVKSELWLSEFTDPDGNQLALMSEVALASV